MKDNMSTHIGLQQTVNNSTNNNIAVGLKGYKITSSRNRQLLSGTNTYRDDFEPLEFRIDDIKSGPRSKAKKTVTFAESVNIITTTTDNKPLHQDQPPLNACDFEQITNLDCVDDKKWKMTPCLINSTTPGNHGYGRTNTGILSKKKTEWNLTDNFKYGDNNSPHYREPVCVRQSAIPQSILSIHKYKVHTPMSVQMIPKVPPATSKYKKSTEPPRRSVSPYGASHAGIRHTSVRDKGKYTFAKSKTAIILPKVSIKPEQPPSSSSSPGGKQFLPHTKNVPFASQCTLLQRRVSNIDRSTRRNVDMTMLMDGNDNPPSMKESSSTSQIIEDVRVDVSQSCDDESTCTSPEITLFKSLSVPLCQTPLMYPPRSAYKLCKDSMFTFKQLRSGVVVPVLITDVKPTKKTCTRAVHQYISSSLTKLPLYKAQPSIPSFRAPGYFIPRNKPNINIAKGNTSNLNFH